MALVTTMLLLPALPPAPVAAEGQHAILAAALRASHATLAFVSHHGGAGARALYLHAAARVGCEGLEQQQGEGAAAGVGVGGGRSAPHAVVHGCSSGSGVSEAAQSGAQAHARARWAQVQAEPLLGLLLKPSARSACGAAAFDAAASHCLNAKRAASAHEWVEACSQHHDPEWVATLRRYL